MSLRLSLIAIAAPFLVAAVANASAASNRSAVVKVSLKIEELCQISSHIDSSEKQSPVVQCQHDTPYRLFQNMPQQPNASSASPEAIYQRASMEGLWEVEF